MICTNCGAALSADDLTKPECRFCGAVLPHRAKAAEKAAVVQELLADRDGDGIPDIFGGVAGSVHAGGAGAAIAGGGPGAVVVKTMTYSSSSGGEMPDEMKRALAQAGLGHVVGGAVATAPSTDAVFVTWADGNRYPARVHQRDNGRCLVELGDGRRIWVDDQYVEPA